jgi:ATPase subunit of ABC transporter with duplicated ATPase domains
MMLSGANVLILDEPTNHLDLEAIQSLNKGLELFSGVVLFNSHDHEFITSIATRIVEIIPNDAVGSGGAGDAASGGDGGAPGAIIDRQMPFDDYLADETVKEIRAQAYHGKQRL